MRKFLLQFLALVAASAHAQIVTNTIDPFTTPQIITLNRGTTNDTTTAAGALGGYRTISLNVTNSSQFATAQFYVDGEGSLVLSTPPTASANFTVKWGGAGGTTGLGGVDLIAGNPTPSQSSLKFALRQADFSSSFTWSFTDTAAQTASYTGTFPIESPAGSDLAYDIALSSFSGTINWNSINFVTFSGGGVANLDLILSAPVTMETTMMAPVPEPGTWAAAALLAGLAGFIHWRRRRANA
jgi:hypothetical protein